jgi:hypothetical protein
MARFRESGTEVKPWHSILRLGTTTPDAREFSHARSVPLVCMHESLTSTGRGPGDDPELSNETPGSGRNRGGQAPESDQVLVDQAARSCI